MDIELTKKEESLKSSCPKDPEDSDSCKAGILKKKGNIKPENIKDFIDDLKDYYEKNCKTIKQQISGKIKRALSKGSKDAKILYLLDKDYIYINLFNKKLIIGNEDYYFEKWDILVIHEEIRKYINFMKSMNLEYKIVEKNEIYWLYIKNIHKLVK